MSDQRNNAERRRTGRRVAQPGGYSAFVPAPLPPDPPLRLEGRLQALLSEADRALGRLDGVIQTLPGSDLFMLMYVRKEAVLSSRIEGTRSTLHDVLAAETHPPSRSARDVDEVINYAEAMNYGVGRLRELPISVRLFRELHERLLSGTRAGSRSRPGELRTGQNWIGPAGARIDEATFVPPPPGEVPPALNALEKFLHDDDDTPALVRIGLAHAQFETIHPFVDGNGRVGRLMIALLLHEREMLARPVLYISHFFNRHRLEYYDRLQAVHDAGDWEGWLEFFLRGVAEVSNDATLTARRILELREAHRDAITSELGRVAGGGLRVLEGLYRQPVVTVRDVQEIAGVSYTAANNLVARLTSLGVLEAEAGRKRNRAFWYRGYVAIFAERDEAGSDAG